jgi:hypothetical protein
MTMPMMRDSLIHAPFALLIHVNHRSLISGLGSGDRVYALWRRFNICETRARDAPKISMAIGSTPLSSAQVEMICFVERKQRRRKARQTSGQMSRKR